MLLQNEIAKKWCAYNQVAYVVSPWESSLIHSAE